MWLGVDVCYHDLPNRLKQLRPLLSGYRLVDLLRTAPNQKVFFQGRIMRENTRFFSSRTISLDTAIRAEPAVSRPLNPVRCGSTLH